MIRKIVHTISIFLLISTYLFFPVTSKAASDFEVISDFTLNYTSSDYVEVQDFVTYKVNNDKYFLQSGLEQTFYLNDYSTVGIAKEREFKLKTLKVLNQSEVPLKYSTKENKEGLVVSVRIGEKINPYEDYTLQLTYKTHDLVNVSGNIVNMYVPGLPKNVKYTERGNLGLTTQYSYNANILTPLNMPLPSYTQPNTINYKDSSKNRIFTINSDDRIGKVAWLQFGSSQYYKFKLVQNSLKTDNLTPPAISNIAPIVSTNIYKIALPREYDENAQRVLINSLNPKPVRIETDFDGNIIAVFEVPANSDSKITVEGIISLALKDIKSKKNIEDINLEEYKTRLTDLQDLKTYIEPDKYWESNDPTVQSLANIILKNSSSILELVQNDYEYIVKTFDYSNEKLAKGNIRLGAKAALTGSQTICMEYSDAMTALLRAQGIPARIAIGYGNDPLSKENSILNNKLSKQLIGHQWTQVWIPDYGWMSVDPTWGESSRTYIGSDLDHILWYTIGKSTQNVTDAIFYSAEQGAIGSHEVYLQALTEEEAKPLKDSAQPISSFNITNEKSQENLDFYIKTSLAGRIIIYLLPIATTIVASILITSIIYVIKRRISKLKYKGESDRKLS